MKIKSREMKNIYFKAKYLNLSTKISGDSKSPIFQGGLVFIMKEHGVRSTPQDDYRRKNTILHFGYFY